MKKTNEIRTDEESVRTRNPLRQTLHSNEVIPGQPSRQSTNQNPSPQYSALQRWLGPFLITAETLATLLVLFFEIRVFLLMAFADLAELSAAQLGQLFFVGLQFDLLVGLIVLMPQILFIAAHNNNSIEQQGSKWMLHSGLFGTITGVLFVCLADVLCFVEFKARLNVEELSPSGKFDATIMGRLQSYPVIPLAFLTGVIAIGLFLFIRRRALERLKLPLSLPHRTVTFFVAVAMIMALGRIMSIEKMHVTTDQVANQCSGNGIYTLCHDLWQRCNSDEDGRQQTTNAPKTDGLVR